LIACYAGSIFAATSDAGVRGVRSEAGAAQEARYRLSETAALTVDPAVSSGEGSSPRYGPRIMRTSRCSLRTSPRASHSSGLDAFSRRRGRQRARARVAEHNIERRREFRIEAGLVSSRKSGRAPDTDSGTRCGARRAVARRDDPRASFGRRAARAIVSLSKAVPALHREKAEPPRSLPSAPPRARRP
jgi:hypothetical protein